MKKEKKRQMKKNPHKFQYNESLRMKNCHFLANDPGLIMLC